MDDLTGRTAVVTGAASGIGRAMADRFARAGMNVVMADVEAPRLDKAVREVNASDTSRRPAIGIVTDVSDGASVDHLRDGALDAFGRIDVVCNNAGVGGTPSGGALLERDWRWVIDVNLWGVFHGHRTFLPLLVEQGAGHVVNTASMAGHFPGHSAYSASKWAVVGITEGLYHQLAGTGVGVSCLCPGWVNTSIDRSVRNRPEWAAPDHAIEPTEEEVMRRAFVVDQLRSGMDPAGVADLVHDAIVSDRFWIFTDSTMVQRLVGRYRSILDGTNPPAPMA